MPSSTKGSDRPARPWWFLGLVVVLVLGLAYLEGFDVRARRARRRLDVQMREFRARGEPATPEDLATAPVLDDQNAALDFLAAGAAVSKPTSAGAAASWVPLYLPWSDDERTKILAALSESRGAVAQAHAGAQKTKVDWGVRPTSPLPLIYLGNHLPPARELSVRLKMAALECHARGDDRAALERVADSLALARALQRLPGAFVAHLIAAGIRSMACDVLMQCAAELRVGQGPTDATPHQVRALIDALLDDNADRESLRAALLEERVEAMDHFESFLAMRMAVPGGNPAALRAGMYFMRAQILNDERWTAEWLTDGMKQAVAANDLLTARANPNSWAQELEAHRERHSPITLRPDQGRTVELFYRIRTEAHLTAVLLALRLHVADHGHFPKTLGALKPTYLASVPNDPLARSAPPLHFIFDDVDPRVYSVGLDAVDDGGNEAPYHPERRDPHWDSPDLVYHYVRQPRPNYAAMYEPQPGALGPAVPLTPAPDAPSSAP